MHNAKLIVIIDDDESLRFALRYALQDKGFEVLDDATAQCVIDKLKDKRPALVFMDYILDKTTGVEEAALLWKHFGKNLKVVLMSGGQPKINYQDTPFVKVLQKPFSLSMLQEVASNLTTK